MPFVYRLHYSLALDTIGTYAFGIIALLWTLDCFIGAYLTLPRGRQFFEKEDIDDEQLGGFVTRWIVDLHMARVWGLPFRIFVCVMGVVVTALSITGIVIWWRKRRGRSHRYAKL